MRPGARARLLLRRRRASRGQRRHPASFPLRASRKGGDRQVPASVLRPGDVPPRRAGGYRRGAGDVPGGMRVPGRRPGRGRDDAGVARRQDSASGGRGGKGLTRGWRGRDRPETTRPIPSAGHPPRGGRVPGRPSSTFRTGKGDRKGGFRMMPRLSSVVKQHPMVTFFVLAYALSWWPSILYALDLLPQPIVGFGPFLAALVVLAITQGKIGIVGLLRRMVRWRVAPVWYAVALLLPIAITLGATVLNVLLGAQAPSSAELGGWTSLFSTFFILLLIPGLGGAWEEPGWRGYALPRLQVGRSALFASLFLWVGVAVWHLPLMIVGEIPWSEIVFILGF